MPTDYDFYIASGRNNFVLVRAFNLFLRRKGYKTFDFTAGECRIAYDPVVSGIENNIAWYGHNEVISRAGINMDAIMSSDTIVALLPGGYGTHIEIGMGIGLSKTVITVGPRERCAMYHLVDAHYPDIDHFLREHLAMSVDDVREYVNLWMEWNHKVEFGNYDLINDREPKEA